jgi:glycerophosphoryl diester phosphodiesterase
MIGVEKGLRNASVRVVMVHSKTTTDRQTDVIKLVRLIHNENLFTNKPGRKHVSFSDMEVNLFKNIVPTNFKARLKRLVKEMAEKEAVVKQMQAN